MGGIGSGRRYHLGAKNATDDYRMLDVRRWHRDGLLTPGRAFSWSWTLNNETVASIQVRTEAGQVILFYRHRSQGSDWKTEEYPVRLDWSRCNFGGRRVSFCPAKGCGRRVAILHGAIFACRHCYQLAYSSQQEVPMIERHAELDNKIRTQLNWEPGILNGEGHKPKGMHWRTFKRLRAEHEIFVGKSLASFIQRFGFDETAEFVQK